MAATPGAALSGTLTLVSRDKQGEQAFFNASARAVQHSAVLVQLACAAARRDGAANAVVEIPKAVCSSVVPLVLELLDELACDQPDHHLQAWLDTWVDVPTTRCMLLPLLVAGVELQIAPLEKVARETIQRLVLGNNPEDIREHFHLGGGGSSVQGSIVGANQDFEAVSAEEAALPFRGDSNVADDGSFFVVEATDYLPRVRFRAAVADDAAKNCCYCKQAFSVLVRKHQ